MARRWAILIANDRYSDDAFSRLFAPVAEARALADLLVDPEVGAFDDVKLVDNESKSGVERELDRMLTAADVDDLVLVYFSGHGALSRGGRLHLAVTNTDNNRLVSTAVSAAWLRDLLHECAAASVVIMLDCCYSGAYPDGTKAGPIGLEEQLGLEDQVKVGRGRYLLTATTAVQRAADGSAHGAAHGAALSAFTGVVIDGLRSGDADLTNLGWITPEDLGRYVRTELPKRTPWQTPTTRGSVQDDVYLARVRAGARRSRAADHQVRLGDLLGELTDADGLPLCAPKWRGYGPLIVPIGQPHRPGLPPGEPIELDLAGPAGNILLVGRAGSGKSTLLRTLVSAMVLTHSPDEVAFFCLESAGNRLGQLNVLRHIYAVAGDDEPEKVDAIIAVLREAIARRRKLFREHGLGSSADLRSRRPSLPDGPHPDIFLVVDRWHDFHPRYRQLARDVVEIADQGLEYGVHVIIAARRWADLPDGFRGVALSRIELYPADDDAVAQATRDRFAQISSDRPGWAILNRQMFRTALPNVVAGRAEQPWGPGDDGAQSLVQRVTEAWGWDPDDRPQWPPTGGPTVPVVGPIDEPFSLLTLLRVDPTMGVDTRVTWRPRPDGDRLRLPVGLDPGGAAVALDLKEAAQGGMGPHGLVIGSTGSGKSELLRTIVASLALTHSSEELNFVLIDFKGGATFAALDELPHTSAVITNLSDELSMVDRMQDALAGEIVRRQEVLRAGRFSSQPQYARARSAGQPLQPMPSLVIICDEFSELLTARPEFIDLFVMIGRLGRSLGVHLLLASQRLEEGRLRGLDSHLSYRIGLRTFSAVESRIVLGVPDAYELPHGPGHGYLRTGSASPVRFRGPHGSALARQPAGADDPGTSEIEFVVAGLRGQGPPAHQVWLPPLDDPPTLTDLLGPVVADERRGLWAAGWPGAGRLTVPIGVVDRPFEQRRDPFELDLAGAGGNVAIVGAPQSGKSTLLRSMLCALALTHTPAEVQLIGLDFGGGTLAGLSGLPHVSGVAGRRDAEAVRRSVAEVLALLDHREARFTEQGIDSVAEYRRRRAEGGITDDPFGDLFLVVDGWGTLREEYEELESTITTLAARGLGFGIHVIVTATRWTDIRLRLRDVLGSRVELRLGDPAESEVDRRAAANVPPRTPGRGLTPDKLHFLGALPRIDTSHTPHDLAEASAQLVQAVRAGWRHPVAPAVRLLPRQLALAELREWAGTGPGVPIGLNEAALAPVRLDFAADPHFYAFGDSECGKTNLLRVIAHTIVERHEPGQAMLVVADYRRGLLGAVPDPHLLGYAPSGQVFTGMVAAMRDALTKRIPAADVTAGQLRDRSWWSGPDIYVIVDDYDLVAGGGSNPLASIVDFLPQARDIGLHLILTRRAGGASRALYDPVIQRLRELDSPFLLMSGNREEGVLVGNLRPSPQPPGRGTLVRRSDGTQLIQTAWLDPVP